MPRRLTALCILCCSLSALGATLDEIRHQAMLAGAQAADSALRGGETEKEAAAEAGKVASTIYKSLGGDREQAVEVAGDAAAAAIHKFCRETDCTAKAEEARKEQMSAVHTGESEEIDCGVAQWSGWAPCVMELGDCGAGKRNRTRTVFRPASISGKQCPDLIEHKPCNGISCNCTVTTWSDWDVCSTSCGQGSQNRRREVVKKSEPKFHCPPLVEHQQCNVAYCPVMNATEEVFVTVTLSVWSPELHKLLNSRQGRGQMSLCLSNVLRRSAIDIDVHDPVGDGDVEHGAEHPFMVVGIEWMQMSGFALYGAILIYLLTYSDSKNFTYSIYSSDMADAKNVLEEMYYKNFSAHFIHQLDYIGVEILPRNLHESNAHIMDNPRLNKKLAKRMADTPISFAPSPAPSPAPTPPTPAPSSPPTLVNSTAPPSPTPTFAPTFAPTAPTAAEETTADAPKTAAQALDRGAARFAGLWWMMLLLAMAMSAAAAVMLRYQAGGHSATADVEAATATDEETQPIIRSSSSMVVSVPAGSDSDGDVHI